MKRKVFLSTVAAAWLLCGVTSCKSTDVHEEVKAIRTMHVIYRDNTVPKDESKKDKVNELANKIDEALSKLEELTK